MEHQNVHLLHTKNQNRLKRETSEKKLFRGTHHSNLWILIIFYLELIRAVKLRYINCEVKSRIEISNFNFVENPKN